MKVPLWLFWVCELLLLAISVFSWVVFAAIKDFWLDAIFFGFCFGAFSIYPVYRLGMLIENGYDNMQEDASFSCVFVFERALLKTNILQRIKKLFTEGK